MPRAKKSDQLLSKLSRSMEPPAPSPADGETPSLPKSEPAPSPAAPMPSPSAPAPAELAPSPAEPMPEPAPAATASTADLPPPLAPAPIVSEPTARAAAAEEIVRRYVPYALGAGLVPLPLLDVAAISGVQLKLVAELSALYGVEFTPHRARNLVTALLGGVGAWTLAAGAFGSAIKVLPGVGTFFGAGTLPLMAGTVTYATGRMFIAHFDSGGTLIDFDAVALRSAFAAKLAEGKAVVRSL